MFEKFVIVLAAGKGSRTFSKKPKGLSVLGGKALLDYVLSHAQVLSPKQLSVVVGYGADEVKSHLSAHQNICWVDQNRQLGTGHAVKCAIEQTPALNEQSIVLVLYGDVPILDQDSLDILFSKAHASGICLLTKLVENPHGYGRIIRCSTSHQVQAIVEHRDANHDQLSIREVNTGIMAVRLSLLKKWLSEIKCFDNKSDEFYLTDIVSQAFESGYNVGAVLTASELEARGVNTLLQLASLERDYQLHVLSSMALRGLQVADLNRVDVRGDLKFGDGVFVDVNTVFVGQVCLGDRSQVGVGCVLTNCSIGCDVVIKPFSVLEDCIVEAGCVVGPYAHVHSDSHLNKAVVVGNFVEIKKSHVGAHTKVKHLAYAGDAKIGEAVNFGAGSIVCNYDGQKKHKTVIGDGAFVGSNVALVAPVEVGDNAVIGAGSVVTKDAPAGHITITRADQKSIKVRKK